MKPILRQNSCTCYRCRSKSTSFWAAYAGLCNRHYSSLEDDDFWVGICWNCGTITAMGPRKDSIGKEEIYIKDRYIFSKGCKRCTNDEENNISWMTIKADSESTAYVTPDSKLLLKSSLYQKALSPELNKLKSGSQGMKPNLDVMLGFDWDE